MNYKIKKGFKKNVHSQLEAFQPCCCIPRAATWSRQGSQAKCLRSTKWRYSQPDDSSREVSLTSLPFLALTRSRSNFRISPTWRLCRWPPPSSLLSTDERKSFHSASIPANSSKASWTSECLYQAFIVSSKLSQESIRFLNEILIV